MKTRVIGMMALAMGTLTIAGPAAADATPEGSSIRIPSPPAGKGQVVFYRTGGMVGAAMGCTVKEGETKISSLGGGRYVIVVTEPGTHNYQVRSEARDALTLLVEPDETQFVRCKIKMGIVAGRPDIAPATAAEFVDASEKLKLVDDDDMGQGALRAADLPAAQ